MAIPDRLATPPARRGGIGLTKALAKERGRYNINVNTVGFGLIQPRTTQPLKPGGELHMAGKEIPIGVQPALLDSAVAACPLGRLGTP